MEPKRTSSPLGAGRPGIHTVPIHTAQPYEALIGRGLLAQAGALLGERLSPRAAALVADATVMGLYGEAAAQSLAQAGFAVSRFSFPAGEASKSLNTLERLLVFLSQSGITRGDLLVALGGGVCGDLAGFAAAVYLRGMPYVQLPTTLLAAVDSSAGGKTAVNLATGKNLCGAFHQPALVVCDCDTFATLPPEALAGGVAEAIKYGVLADAALFSRLAHGLHEADLPDIVARCVAHKARYVEQDERDRGSRRLLNLGHTVGHAVELLSGYTIPHGHAVATGMAVMARAAERLGFAQGPIAQPLCAALARNGLPTRTPYTAQALAQAACADKKRTGDTITLVVPLCVGKAMLHPIPAAGLADFLAAGLEEAV